MTKFLENRIDFLASLARNQDAFSPTELDEAVANVAAEMLFHLRNPDTDVVPGAIFAGIATNPEPVAPLPAGFRFRTARDGYREIPKAEMRKAWREVTAEDLGIPAHLRPRSESDDYLIARVQSEAAKQGKEAQVTRKAA